jgi:ketosteroid isomerase-like protein
MTSRSMALLPLFGFHLDFAVPTPPSTMKTFANHANPGDEQVGSITGGAGASVTATEQDVANLTRRSAEANSALIRGDIDGYLALIEPANDFTLMSPFGGTPTRGFDTSPEYRKAIGRFFKSGTFHQEVVATYGSADMVVLVTIERVRGEVGGLPEQDWSLRVTQVYRRQGAEWQLVHRHADPLANGIGLEQSAALARGGQR